MTDIFDGRLAALMEDRKNVSAFARKCGVSDTMMRKYLTGKAMPSAERASAIARINGVNLQWLVTGEGPMNPGETQADLASAPAVALDGDLMGRVVDVIERVYGDLGVRLPRIDLGRLAAEKYAEIAEDAEDVEEWPALLDLLGKRLKRSLLASAADPTSIKREA